MSSGLEIENKNLNTLIADKNIYDSETIMEQALDFFEFNYIDGFGHIMLSTLDQFRKCISKDLWENKYIPELRKHELYEKALECPFCHHSTIKPRGYDGDALLLDFLYKEDTVSDKIESSTENGKKMCYYWASSPAAAAVRYRKDLIAYHINKIAEKDANASIFSVACGHFREINSTNILEKHKDLKMIGLDSDQNTIDFVKSNKYGDRIDLINSSISGILRNKVKLEKLNFVYASGLYDYLEDRVAKRFTKVVFDMLDSGGYMLIPNFLPTATNRASMELLQDWFLIYRSKDEINSLVEEINLDEILGISYLEDPYKSIGYTFVYKK